MALFPVSGATGDHMLELKNVLTAANAITTLYYYQASVALVFLSPYSNKVIKFTVASGRITLTIGDAWTSTTVITNPIVVANSYSSPMSATGSHAIITTADTLVFALSGASSVIFIFSKFTNTNFMVCCSDENASLPDTYVMRVYNTTTMEKLLPAFYPYLMKSDTNYYHQFNPVWRTALNSYYRDHQFTASIRELMRNSDLGLGIVFEISGNDVIVPFSFLKDTILYDQNTCMVIVGGNI